MKYTITIRAQTPYSLKGYKYEGTNGETYAHRYGLPEGVEVKILEYETGEIGYTESDLYIQTVEEIDLPAIIKAINKI
jgi:hypothetical protein